MLCVANGIVFVLLTMKRTVNTEIHE